MSADLAGIKAHLASMSSLLGLTFLAFVFYILSVIVYRLTLHPLARYPGPFLAKVTSLHHAYHTWKGDRHLQYYECHAKYGSVYRFKPNSVSFNTPKALQSIYGFHTNVNKSDMYKLFRIEGRASVFNSIDKAQHARKRRVLAHAFSDRALNGMEDYMLTHIRDFCSKLGKSGQPLDMTAWFEYLTFDVMGELTFGKPFGMLNSDSLRYITDTMHDSGALTALRGAMPALNSLGLDKLLFPTLVRTRASFSKFAVDQAKARTKITTDRKDFYDYLISSTDPESGEKLMYNEIWGEANTLIVAGTDTSSNAMAGTIFYLLHNPRVLEKVTKEVREAFIDADVIRGGPALNSCHYLRACLDETLRCSPSVPAYLPRVVLRGGADIDGHHFGEGIEVGISPYAIHHHEKCYPNPFEYLPERWIAEDDSEEEKAKVDRTLKAFLGFGGNGPRGCLGKNMAYHEMMLAMAHVLYDFDMKLISDIKEHGPREKLYRVSDEEMLMRDSFGGRREGPMVVFTRAKAS